MPAWLLNKWVLGAIGGVIALFLIWLAINRYADSVADERETEVRAEYKAASDRLRAEAERSATRADDDAANRLELHQNQVREEQERIDAAEANGSSTFDILFGS